MKSLKKANLFLTVLIALTMVFAAVQPVFAQEETGPTEITGEVVAIVLPTETEPGSFDVQTESGIVTVFPGEGYDFTMLEMGDMVMVSGAENEDGSLAAEEITIEEPQEPEEPMYPNEGYYCTQSEDMHPMGARLAERYEMDYTTLQGWFCEGYGWGQVMLALQTGTAMEMDPAMLLEARDAGEGWGNIWQELGMIGKPDKDKDKDDDEDMEEPEMGADEDDDKGKPDFAGPPSDKDKDKDKDNTPNPNSYKDKDKKNK
ncbi:MAG: hypothetical protein GYA48_13005 [Chloroflexi bacterium]|nr:hypothetical protein [Chloroflexota bacterium]